MFNVKKAMIYSLFLSNLMLFSCSNNSNLVNLSFSSTLDLLNTYQDKEKYFLSTLTFKMDYVLTEFENVIEGTYELDLDQNSYYLYSFSKSNEGINQRLIYKNDKNQYVEYIYGKNIASTENYVEKMFEARNIIKKYALYNMEIVNNEGNTYVFNKSDGSLELNLASKYFKVLNNGLISEVNINNEDGSIIKTKINYSLSLNRRKSL